MSFFFDNPVGITILTLLEALAIIVPVLIILAVAGYALSRAQARRRPLGW